jgi:hypothetical protein
VKLTPVPLHLLVAMSRGVVLHECLKDTYFSIERRPSRGFERIHTRAVNDLRRREFIERAQDPLEWRVSAAGRAWLAASGIVADLEKLSKSPSQFGGSNGGRRRFQAHT